MGSGSGAFTSQAGLLLVSAATHVLALYVLPSAPPPQPMARVVASSLVLVEVEEPPPPPPPPRPAPPAPERDPTRSDPVRPDRMPPPVPIPTTPDPAPPPTGERDPPPGPPVVPNPNPILDPLAAARTVLDVEGPRMPAVQVVEPGELDPEGRDRALSMALTESLGVEANARPEGFGRRSLPEPVRRADGTLAYTLSTQLTAIVNPDGTFTFNDAGNVSFGGMGGATREGMQVGWGLEEWLMRRHGDDPFASDRRWFANQTEAMRERMAEAYLERQAASAARGVRGRATRILSDADAPLEDRRRRIFAIWDDCAEGERVGDAVRAAIVAFVRERMPVGSPEAYPDAELDALNRTRESTAEFRPYQP